GRAMTEIPVVLSILPAVPGLRHALWNRWGHVNDSGVFRCGPVSASLASGDRSREKYPVKKKPTAHEALIYLMVVTSASDRDMTDVELARIGDVVKSWPIFEDFDPDKLVKVAQDCQKRLHEDGGLTRVIAAARDAVPLHLHETAYAAAF